MDIAQWLDAVPPTAVWIIVGAVICLESLGIPLPGEIVLVSATLLATGGTVSPIAVGVAAALGAVVGDSIGYAIGRKGGRPLFEWLGRKFPKHFGPRHLAHAERSFERWGMWAVFIGRFIALLRIFAGPLAGTLHMPYWRFLTANLLGGVAWAGGTTTVIFFLGKAAEAWLSRFSWIGLLLAIVIGLLSMVLVRRRMGTGNEDSDTTTEQSDGAETAQDSAPEAPAEVTAPGAQHSTNQADQAAPRTPERLPPGEQSVSRPSGASTPEPRGAEKPAGPSEPANSTAD